jgi:hypothetical protein
LFLGLHFFEGILLNCLTHFCIFLLNYYLQFGLKLFFEFLPCFLLFFLYSQHNFYIFSQSLNILFYFLINIFELSFEVRLKSLCRLLEVLQFLLALKYVSFYNMDLSLHLIDLLNPFANRRKHIQYLGW